MSVRMYCVVGLVAAVGMLGACGSVSGGEDASVSPDANRAATDAALTDAPPDQPDATPLSCVPDATTCNSNVMTVCDSNGDVASTTDCALACHATEPRCNDISPSNGLGADLDLAASAPVLVLTDGAVIDTTAGTVTDGDSSSVAVPSRFIDGGPVGIFVIRAKSVVLGTTTVVGTRALAIVSDGDITLRGLLDASAEGRVGGPGAVSDDPACAGGNGAGFGGATADSSAYSGGGGGAFGSVGGAGGRAGSVTGGSAGAVAGSANLIPLRGGCPGGGRLGTASGTFLSGAGGAVQLVSRTAIRVEAAGQIGVGGTAGALPWVSDCGQFNCFCIIGTNCFAGYGGGAGGGILLEAPTVSVAAGAGLFANGGGGSFSTGAGTDARLSTVPAPGGTANGVTAGAGAAGTIAAKAGQSAATATHMTAPGGGGGVGRIRINLPAGGRFEPPAGFASSPTPTVGSLEVR